MEIIDDASVIKVGGFMREEKDFGPLTPNISMESDSV
jgi:hypothetical protein